MRGMRAPMIVEDHPVADSLTSLPPAREGVQIDALVLQRAPQPLDEDVVEEPTASIHRDAYPGLSQPLRPRPRRELAASADRSDPPESVLKISGWPWRSNASSSASTQNCT